MTHLTERLSARLAAGSALAQRSLRSPVRTKRMAVVLGRVLALAFVVCFITGLYSHLLQDPLPGMRFPTEPVWTMACGAIVLVLAAAAMLRVKDERAVSVAA